MIGWKRKIRLVGLVAEDEIVYLYGDGAKRRISPRAVGPPIILWGMRFATPYSEQVRILTSKAPKGANAFLLGAPQPDRVGGNTAYGVLVQFCRISDLDFLTGLLLKKHEWGLAGIVERADRRGDVRARDPLRMNTRRYPKLPRGPGPAGGLSKADSKRKRGRRRK